MDLNLSGKTALVIASSQGLGFAIAKALVKEGTNVMISGRDVEKLKKKAAELEALGLGKVAFQKTDVTKTEDIKQLVSKTIEIFGTLQILVNNAGGPPAGTFEELTDEKDRLNALTRLNTRQLPMNSSETMHLTPQWPFPADSAEMIAGIFFRIHINRKTGRFEKFGVSSQR